MSGPAPAVRAWAIYTAPPGSPAPYVAMPWDTSPGERARPGEPIYAASLEQARDVIPKGLARHPPVDHPGEAENLIETWEESHV